MSTKTPAKSSAKTSKSGKPIKSEKEDGAQSRTVKKRQRIRIRLRSFDNANLDQSSQKIVETAQSAGARIVGPIPLPTQKKVWCVLKSPHVNKRGGEHYEIRIHKRIIDIVDPPASAVEALMQLELPAGVNIEIKLG